MIEAEAIDWSKGPKDAQFLGPDTDNHSESWYKLEGSTWFFCRTANRANVWNTVVPGTFTTARLRELIHRPKE